MKVIELQISNFLNVKAVVIKPEGNIIKIEGHNGQGKTNVIDAIWAAIGGKDALPVSPIRKGEKEGSIFIDLNDIRVTRKFTQKGTYLEVTNKEGLKYPSPQALLDSLFTTVSIDPLNFCLMKPTARREELLNLTGKRKELEGLDKEKEIAFGERTFINREIKTIEGKLVGLPEPIEGEEILVSDLMTELQARQCNNRSIVNFENLIKGKESNIFEIEKLIASSQAEIKELKSQIKEIKGRSEDLQLQDEEEIKGKIASADQHNSAIRLSNETKRLRDEFKKKQSEADNFTAIIDKAQADKVKILTSANLPIPYLSIEADTILVNGIPFDDLSSSEQLKISLQIGIAQNPKLHVLRIERGSELDRKSMEQVEILAKANDYQIWIERVVEKKQDGIFIEEGEIK